MPLKQKDAHSRCLECTAPYLLQHQLWNGDSMINAFGGKFPEIFSHLTPRNGVMCTIEIRRIPWLPLISNLRVNSTSIVRVDITHLQACISKIEKA
jgi:hypothetical protein